MNKTYRLLKDLPGVKAGAIFTHTKILSEDCYSNRGKNEFIFSQSEIDQSTDWFEDVNPEYYSETKYKNGQVLNGKGGLKVVYLGKGRAKCKALFTGVVIDYPDIDYKHGEIRDDFFRGCFKPAQ